MALKSEAFERLLNDLDAQRPADSAAACALWIMILGQAKTPPLPSGLAAKFIALFAAEDVVVQRNSVAAFSAAVEADTQFVQEALASDAAAQLAKLLAVDPAAADAGLLQNAATAIGALAESGSPGLQAVIDADSIAALLALCPYKQDGSVQEAAVDAFCKCLSCGGAAKSVADDAGAISLLTGLLADGEGSAEVQVRSLLSLGMLVGGVPERQLQFASTPGSVASLMKLMRREDDRDCQQISASLFSDLGRSPSKEVRAAVTAGLKAAQEAAAQPAAQRTT